MRLDLRCALLCLSINLASGSDGVLMLYRPRDVSLICSGSTELRYDLSYGMGMSDTITLVFRTLNEVNYGCFVEIVTEKDINLLLVIKYPTSVTRNCLYNPNALTVITKKYCTPVCSTIQDEYDREQYASTMYFSLHLSNRARFRFESNSTINNNLNANMYQVTATAARKIEVKGNCAAKNETPCVMDGFKFCFTSGVYCDGIKNCGTMDWFDEEKLGCGLPIQKLSVSAVLAVVAALCLAVLAVGHLMLRCLPPLATTFFIFNANEDNRLCIDPAFNAPPEKPLGFTKSKRPSLVPMFSSSSSSSISVEMIPEEQSHIEIEEDMEMSIHYTDTEHSDGLSAQSEIEEVTSTRRANTMRNISAKVNKFLGQLRSVDSKSIFHTQRT